MRRPELRQGYASASVGHISTPLGLATPPAVRDACGRGGRVSGARYGGWRHLKAPGALATAVSRLREADGALGLRYLLAPPPV